MEIFLTILTILTIIYTIQIGFVAMIFVMEDWISSKRKFLIALIPIFIRLPIVAIKKFWKLPMKDT